MQTVKSLIVNPSHLRILISFGNQRRLFLNNLILCSFYSICNALILYLFNAVQIFGKHDAVWNIFSLSLSFPCCLSLFIENSLVFRRCKSVSTQNYMLLTQVCWLLLYLEGLNGYLIPIDIPGWEGRIKISALFNCRFIIINGSCNCFLSSEKVSI